jgi:uncharacterized membrane protein
MIVEKKRHIAKAISYRLISTLIGFTVMLVVTGSVGAGIAFSAAEFVWKPLQYYLHERIWYKWVSYGLKK